MENHGVSGTRITVTDVLSYLASGMTIEDIIEDFPVLDKEKILATLSFATYRDNITKIAFLTVINSIYFTTKKTNLIVPFFYFKCF